ncbi:YbaB/EbfC family nucleoid-associated protein [Nocardia sp. NEAU-G5]|uniref:YbaB/EbfC family nucleoid-associated protein n=1 Tax=Nocardia albiluteola TaxID=2842303 RepID=A0ABS6B414_9NOCA|nr:YbaB/EbfC family nucleoid-associated protein [Nocardia albiluteola]MBU3064868.1 YbaB/EbfC family nucleoid-associated protein [Nocardia albiluteola]
MIHPENRRLAEQTSELVDNFQQAMSRIADARSAQRTMTATASAEHGRIVVTVDVTGAITRTEFSDKVADLPYGAIARGIVTAAQHAAAEVRRKREELLAPLRALRARMPTVDEHLPGLTALAGLRAELPQPVPAPLTPPSEREQYSGPDYGDDMEPRRPAPGILDR